MSRANPASAELSAGATRLASDGPSSDALLKKSIAVAAPAATPTTTAKRATARSGRRESHRRRDEVPLWLWVGAFCTLPFIYEAVSLVPPVQAAPGSGVWDPFW